MSLSAKDIEKDIEQVKHVVNGEVFLGDGFQERDIDICEARIVREGEAAEGICLDASGCIVVPGLIDLHFHGCDGADISDGTIEAASTIAGYEASRGICAICPATMTLSNEQLLQAVDVASRFDPSASQSEIVGINLEGPFISPSKIGAQNPHYVRCPDIEEFKSLQERSDNVIKIVDIAPEVEGSEAFIREFSGKVTISLAHSCATYDEAAHGFDLGMKHMTHLYNAMDPMHHRKPGPIPAAAERKNVTAEIIADGIHIHPSMVRLAFDLFGDDRMVLISDTLRACGLEDGVYDLGGQDVRVNGFEARIENGALAGSVSDLMRCFYVAVKDMQIPLVSAVKAATINPARVLGIDRDYGSLEVGKVANIVILDKDTLEIKHVVLRGRLLY